MSNRSERIANLSTSKLALLAKQTYSQVEDILNAEPIAVIGMACRFPGDANSPEALWKLLTEKRTALSEVPADRWNIDEYYDPDFAAPGKMNNRIAGFVNGIDQFDPAFFGITQREANQMDPQQRLALEVSFEALEDAGLTHDQVRGAQAGVFIASYHNDYQHLVYAKLEHIDLRTLTGTLHCITANRISYLLDFHGPSMALDSACSSSLVAVHLACQSLRNREADFCLAGGVNAILTPGVNVSLSKVGFISPSGHCHTFDDSADGFVRGEGCGMIVLKRLADAVANGDRILAVIRGSAINQDGRSTVLTAPNGQAQQAVVQRALKNAGLAPEQISLIEAHGTGTHLGDPLEVEALAEVIGPQRDENHRCALTSIKANIGHLESAAGIAGLIKVVLSLHNGAIPAHPTFTRLNHNIHLEGTPFYIPTELTPWPLGEKPRYAGVSSFGVGGTNAHVILGEAPQMPVPQPPAGHEKAYFLPISARSPQALVQRVQQMRDFLHQSPDVRPYDLAYTASLRRTHYEHRIGVFGSTTEQMVARLDSLLADPARLEAQVRQEASEQPPRIAFVFSGQGTQWAGMAGALIAQEPVFRQVIEQCDAALKPLAGWSLIDKLTAPEGASDLDQTEVAQPAIFAVQIALAALWKSWGVSPDALVGHSLGEIAAAYISGVLSLEDAIYLVYHRGRLMQQATGQGKMASIALPLAEVEALIAPYQHDVAIAASNAPQATVISGASEAVEAITAEAQARGVTVHPLKVNYAFHSPQMEPYAQALRTVLAGKQSHPGQIPWVSTLTGQEVQGESVNADYWGDNIRKPVRFMQAIEHLMADGVTVFVEVSPHPALSSMIEQCAAGKPASEAVHTVFSLRRGKPESETMLDALRGLYQAGVPIRWEAFFPIRGQLITLPTYPWQHKRCWLEYAPAAHPAPQHTPQLAAENGHPLLGSPLRSPAISGTLYQKTLSSEQPGYLEDHRVLGEAVIPAAAQLEMACTAAAQNLSGAFQLEDFYFQEALLLPNSLPRNVQIHLQPMEQGEFSFKLYVENHEDNWNLLTTGVIRRAEQEQPEVLQLETLRTSLPEQIPGSAFYDLQNQVDGVNFGPAFQGIQQLWRRDGEALAQVQLPDDVASEADLYTIHPALLDAALQPLSAALPAKRRSFVYLPVQTSRLRLFAPLPTKIWSHVIFAESGSTDSVTCQVRVVDDAGRLLLEITGLVLQRVNPTALHRAFQRQISDLLPGEVGQADDGIANDFYQTRWETAPALTVPEKLTGLWMVFADLQPEGISLGSILASQIRAAGGDCLVILPGEAYSAPVNGQATINPNRQEDYRRLFSDLKSGPSLRGIAHLWNLNLPALDEASALAGASIGPGSALYLAQALLTAGLTELPVLAFVTQGSQAAGRAVTAPEGSMVWGLANTLSLEHPEIRCVCLDLDPFTTAEEQARSLLAELAQATAERREDRIAYHQTARLVARLVKTTATEIAEDPQPTRLSATQIGSLNGLALLPASRRAPGPGEVEIRVEAAGLNFRDVLKVLGRYPVEAGDELLLGDECAGVITALGSGVQGLQIGDPVVALASGAFASYVITNAELVLPRPASITPQEAAGIPIPFLTAWYTLYRLAHLQAGQRVLIHAAAGGVGLAAVKLAQRVGAEIFATAGSPAKRDYLRAAGVQHVFDSRSLDFADEILRLTGGQGVDVALNSLAGEFIPKSLSVLAQNGCFLEIGKTGILTPEQAAQTRPDAAYYPVYLGDQFKQAPALIHDMLAQIFDAFKTGELSPLPRRVFPMSSAADAFHFMARARHIGKIVLTQPALHQRLANPEEPLFRANATYLLTGGLGGIGRITARWMVQKGARSLVILSRRGADSPTAQDFIQELQAEGAQVCVYPVDVSRKEDVARVLAEIQSTQPPLRGVIHAAGINEDRMVMQQTWEHFEHVLAGKAFGAWNLHLLTRFLPLDFFVLFSSIAGPLGSPGQANYAAANSVLGAIAHLRAAEGLPALCIDWGAWEQTGMTARLTDKDRQAIQRRGLRNLTPEDGMQALELALRQPSNHLMILPVDWSVYLHETNQARAYFDHIQREPALHVPQRKATEQAHQPELPALLRRLLDTPPAQRKSRLIAHIQQEVIRLVGLEPNLQIDPLQPLNTLGMDSLMAIEMRNALSMGLGKSLSATLMFDYPTSSALADHLLETIPGLKPESLSPEQPPAQPAEPPVPTSSSAQSVAQMSDEEAEAELLAELAKLKKG